MQQNEFLESRRQTAFQAMTDSSLNSSVPSTALLSTILPPIPNSSSSSTPNVRTKHRSNDAALIELIRESAAHQQPSTSINFTTGQECGDEQTNRDIADTCCHAGGGNNNGEGNERRADLITRSSNNTSLNTSSVCAISSTSAGNEDVHLKMGMTSGNNTAEQSKDSGCVMFTSNSMSTIANTTDVSVSHSSTSSTENSPVQLHFKQHQIHTDINDTSCNSANLCSSDLQKGEVSSKTPDRNRHLSQSPPNKASRYLNSKQPIPSELLNMQSFRVMTDCDGFSELVEHSPKLASSSIDDIRTMQSKNWVTSEKDRKCFAVFNSNHRPDSTGNCQHQPPNSSTDSVHINSSVFTIKNENKMQFNSREHQFDSRRVAINSESSANAATSTEDEDERSSPQQNSSRLSSNQDEPNKHYSSLSSTCSSGKFLIPAQLQFTHDTNVTMNSNSTTGYTLNHPSNNSTANLTHFPKTSNNQNLNVSLSNLTNSLVCNAEGQLVVPAGQINLLKAFGELHGYKIQTASNGHGLVLSASNQPSRNNNNSSFPLIKQQPHRPSSYTGLLPMQQVSQDAARKREMRLQKNREAARECRRKKKEYIKCLENRVAVLENQNKALLDDLRQLRELYCQSAAAAETASDPDLQKHRQSS